MSKTSPMIKALIIFGDTDEGSWTIERGIKRVVPSLWLMNSATQPFGSWFYESREYKPKAVIGGMTEFPLICYDDLRRVAVYQRTTAIHTKEVLAKKGNPE